MKNNPFSKVFEIPKNFFKKVLRWGAGAKPRIASPADKSKFEAIIIKNFGLGIYKAFVM